MKFVRLIILLFVLALIGLAIIWLAGTLLTNPVPASFDKTPENAIPVSFKSESGSQIQGWLFEAEKPIAHAVLMHGIRSNRTQMIDRAKHLRSLGIESLVFDFQAHGESSGEIITLGYLESLDAQAAIDFLIARNAHLPRIAIGVSLGGAAAIMAKPALDVDVLVVESVYPDVDTAISNRFKMRIPGGQILTPLLALQIKPRIGVSANELSPVRYAQNIDTSTLVLSGGKDQHTTVANTDRLFDAFAGPKELHIFEGAGHVDLEAFDKKQYWKVVQPFILQKIGR